MKKEPPIDQLNGCYSIKQMDFIRNLKNKYNASLGDILKAIYNVGTNENNIKDYLENANVAVVRKDNGFKVSYTAQRINEKDKIIESLLERLNDNE